MGLLDLFKPAWQSGNQKKALKAVKKLTDQVVLTRVAKEAENYYVRLLAIEKLSDQVVLADIARNKAENENIRFEAAKKLTNQTLALEIFITIAKSGKILFCTNKAANIVLEKTTDPEICAEMEAILRKIEENERMERKRTMDLFIPGCL